MKYKLICFDLDGTLIDNVDFIWNIIHDYFDIDKEERLKAKNAFSQGVITYQQWVDHNIDLWKEKGITKDHLLDAISDVKIMEGALETIQKLKNNGLRIVVMSGGLNFVIDHVYKQHVMLFDYIFINKLVFGEGGKVIGAKATPYDMQYKSEGLKHIAEQENIHLSDCVFVGDHDNDIAIAKTAGLSIAFNPKSSNLIEVCDVLIQNNDLREILKYLE